MTMTLEMAMHERHMVRRYTDKPLSDTIVKRLEARTIENNEKYQLAIALRTDDNQAFNALIRLVLAKGVKNYFLLAGPDTLDLDEKCGLAGADLMLYAQTLGLNTWWVGGTFNRSKLNRSAGANKVIGVIAVGYGADSGKPHASKKPDEVAEYKGEMPAWFSNGVEAALLAPTALNKQAFRIYGEEDRVRITCNNGVFSGADLGLVKYHFMLGAGKENIRWSDEKN